MRFSQKNEHSIGSQDNQSSTQNRTQAPSSLAFPKSARILSRKHYKNLSKDHKTFYAYTLAVRFRLGQVPCPKLGLTVSRKFGNAVKRNHFKRLVREAFRKHHALFPEGIELNVHPKNGSVPNYAEVEADLLDFIKKVLHGHAES